MRHICDGPFNETHTWKIHLTLIVPHWSSQTVVPSELTHQTMVNTSRHWKAGLGDPHGNVLISTDLIWTTGSTRGCSRRMRPSEDLSQWRASRLHVHAKCIGKEKKPSLDILANVRLINANIDFFDANLKQLSTMRKPWAISERLLVLF